MKTFIKNIMCIAGGSLLFFTACSRYPSALEETLRFAGENRRELEKVLEHYNPQGEDSLKYRAACFLIENMQYHYTRNTGRLDAFRAFLRDIVPSEQTYSQFVEKFGEINQEPYQITYDAQVITAAYLIRNIDFSFRLWQEAPWGKHLGFEHFCEEILPYRLGNEPIEDWKEAYHQKYQYMLDTAHYDRSSPLAACRVIFSYLHSKTEKDLPEWVFAYDWNVSNLGAQTLLNLRYGTCQEQTDMLTYVMRSVGIPAGIDMMVQHPDNLDKQHWWNYMRDTSGVNIAFDYYYEMEEPAEKMTPIHKCGMVYRKCFALQAGSFPVRYPNKDIYHPPSLSDPFLKNVSEEYFHENPVTLPAGEAYRDGDVLYLNVFNNSQWVVMGWSEVKKGNAVFRHLEPGVLYLLTAYPDRETCRPASRPFIPDRDGQVFFAHADTVNRQDMELHRKFRLPWWWEEFHVNSTGGKFQGANRPDFSDAVTLYTIPGPAVMRWEDIYPVQNQTFKYLRYLSGEEGFNMMAEVEFYEGEKKLTGEVIGTEGSYQDTRDKTRAAVFDANPLTYFFAIEGSGAWAGLALDKPGRVSHIRFWFRNDDNTIRPGDTYELHYWGNSQWESMGQQTGTDTVIIYNRVPSRTIYWLRDLTRGREERPFTYENGRQVWW
jgi:hypothetical protein